MTAHTFFFNFRYSLFHLYSPNTGPFNFREVILRTTLYWNTRWTLVLAQQHHFGSKKDLDSQTCLAMLNTETPLIRSTWATWRTFYHVPDAPSAPCYVTRSRPYSSWVPEKKSQREQLKHSEEQTKIGTVQALRVDCLGSDISVPCPPRLCQGKKLTNLSGAVSSSVR